MTHLVSEKEFQATLIDVVRMVGGGLVYHSHDSRREVVKRGGERVLVGDAHAALATQT